MAERIQAHFLSLSIVGEPTFTTLASIFFIRGLARKFVSMADSLSVASGSPLQKRISFSSFALGRKSKGLSDWWSRSRRAGLCVMRLHSCFMGPWAGAFADICAF